MRAHLEILSCGPAVTVQDMGRIGYLAQGLTRGGAADTLALFEGAALLGQSPQLACLEMGGMGGQFRATGDTRIALTGAPMIASIDGIPLAWNASHMLPAGADLQIGGTRGGTYGYLHVGGGLNTPEMMGARGTHLGAGLGKALEAGSTLPLGADSATKTGMTLDVQNRFDGGPIRIIPSMQTDQFDAATRARFTTTIFRRDTRANRMGVRMDHDSTPFMAADQLSILSDVIVPGDIQIAGDGAPFVLMCECQTTGGYPRIGTVLPCDMPRVAQAPAGAAITFDLIDVQTARAAEHREAALRNALPTMVKPLLRNPYDIRDLLSYQLISGAISATSDPFSQEDNTCE
ncbi:biotin-dependent carboxyltransferase family protein [uncultured Sulfitobacter sp.]|uniref:5-oxoprolinase subunit C family protein n=1 Tax=uncultured Sulfitobacter sp. TaxID=191468 RepID=UPI002637E7A0|nr:biotin-dependent carboxyltransferase family protein [uncultured Sulfitobacter sp.]